MSNTKNNRYEDEEEEVGVRDSLAIRLNDLENFCADQYLSDDLKELYAQIQIKCTDFRNNVFFKNCDILEYQMGRPKKPNSMTREQAEKEHESKLHEIKTPKELLLEFSKKEMPEDA